MTPEERKAAIAAPGPSWREWLYGQAFKWWLGIGLMIVDSWIIAGWAELHEWVYLVLNIVPVLYLEYLLYEYLWHPYAAEYRGRFRASWRHPFEVGRWIPERAELLAGTVGQPAGPDPREFL